ncbi:CzcE family metal-binding protein [Cupriavidus sp. CP313]
MTRHHRGIQNPLGKAIRLMAAAALTALSSASFAVQTVEVDPSPQTSSAGKLFGERALSVDGARTVQVTPQTRAIAVHAGEKVRFDFGSTSAGWAFAARPGNLAVELLSLFPDIPAASGIWIHQNGSNVFAGH